VKFKITSVKSYNKDEPSIFQIQTDTIKKSPDLIILVCWITLQLFFNVCIYQLKWII